MAGAPLTPRTRTAIGDLLSGFELVEPGLVDVRVNRGVVLGKLGKLDEAREAFSEILKTTPDCASARQNLAYVLQLQSQAAIAH